MQRQGLHKEVEISGPMPREKAAQLFSGQFSQGEMGYFSSTKLQFGPRYAGNDKSDVADAGEPVRLSGKNILSIFGPSLVDTCYTTTTESSPP
jgi:hypothetical protein